MQYSRILESFLIPAYYSVRGRSYPKLRRFVEGSQWWSRDQIREFQWREARRLLELAFGSVPFYQRKYAEIEFGDIKTPEDFAKLPVLKREEVAGYREEMCLQKARTKLLPHATGGSSGVPTRFFITPESYDWRCAASARAYSWSGYRIGDRTMYLWGSPVGKVSRFQKAKLDSYRFVRRELFIATFQQTPESWRKTFDAAIRFQPKFIVGYVSSIEEFARFLQARDLHISGIQAVIAGAEPVGPTTRELVLQTFRAPLFDTYGSREFMSIAAECEAHNGLHIHADNLLVENESGDDHGPSELLVTDLHNFGMPFIRYRIGDVGALTSSSCPCGRGLPLISVLEGRSLEVLRTPEGRAVSPILWRHVLKDVSEVKEFQVQQTALDEIVVSLVLGNPLSESSETLLRKEMAKVFTAKTRVTIKPVSAIPRLPSGKRRLAVGIGQLN